MHAPDSSVMTASVVQPWSGFSGIMQMMPNPDEILRDAGPDVYKRMLTDAHLKAVLHQRKSRVLSRPWDVKPAAQDAFAVKVADFVRDTFRRELNLDQDLRELLSAFDHGFAVSEAVWRNESGWIIDSLLARRHERFAFRYDRTLLQVRPGPETVLDQPYKWVVHRLEEEPENPYGCSVLAPCYWPWMFKNTTFESWMTVLHRFGVPSLAALFEGGQDEEKLKERAAWLAEQLVALNNGGAAAFANLKDLKTIEAKGDADMFDTLIRLCNSEISKGVLTVSLLTDTDGKGSYALGEVHERALEENVAQFDRRSLAITINRSLVRWQVELRFGEAGLRAKPEFAFDEFQTAPWKDVTEAIDRGVPVSRSKLYSTYNLPEPENEGDAFVKPAGMGAAGIQLSDGFFLATKNRPGFRPR